MYLRERDGVLQLQRHIVACTRHAGRIWLDLLKISLGKQGMVKPHTHMAQHARDGKQNPCTIRSQLLKICSHSSCSLLGCAQGAIARWHYQVPDTHTHAHAHTQLHTHTCRHTHLRYTQGCHETQMHTHVHPVTPVTTPALEVRVGRS